MSHALTRFLEQAGGSARVIPIVVGIVALGLIWGAASYGMAPDWVPVAPGLSLEKMGEATQRLDEAGIDHRLERGGTLLTVPETDAARARVVLAAEGLAGPAGAPGFELFDQPAWGMTDFTQRVNYRRALEGELERTISQMRGVDGAQVHLALRERSFLADAGSGNKASVVLSLRGGFVADDAVVEGVQSLVASAVEALDPSNVTVLDDRGRLLSDQGDDTGLARTAAQLKVRRQIEEYLEKKAEALLTPVVGAGQTSVRVAAELNFDQIDRTVQAVDPDQQTLISEDRSEIIPGSADQGASSVTTNAVYEATRSVETLTRNGARVERLTVAVVVGDRRIEEPDGTVRYEPRSPQELRRIESIVANAVGLSPQRGDQVSVMSAPIEPVDIAPPQEEGLDVIALATTAQRPVVALAALIFAFLLVSRVLQAVRTLTPAPQGSALEAPEPAPAVAAPAEPATELPPVQPDRPARPMVADPEMTARVLRSWLKEG